MADEKAIDRVSKVHVAKNAAELQKIRLEKLMKNPSKPVFIPEQSKEYKPREPLEFIRNVWGSSAGAGSGDFHVYRGVRRREYARQKYMKEKTEKEEADEAYHQKVLENGKVAEERSAKKRAKRLRKKQKQKNNKKQKKDKLQETSDEEEEEEEEKKIDEVNGRKNTISCAKSDSVSDDTVISIVNSTKQQCKDDSESQGDSVEQT